MIDYSIIDQQIVEAIRFGARDFAVISQRVEHERDRIVRELGVGPEHSFRIIDRRLHVLRRRGLIEYAGMRGWVVTERAAA